MSTRISRRALAGDATRVAQSLLGCTLVHQSSEGRTSGIVVETEAYDQTDPASHCYSGLTERNRVMFGPAGFSYVYRSYGIHWCFNVSAGKRGFGAAVLIRALEPIEGVALMEHRRKLTVRRDLARGPGRLTQAMGITADHYGVDLLGETLWLERRPRTPKIIVATNRIGISKALTQPWRFVIAGNRYVSGALVP